jgi:hypothetical protein
MRSIVIMYLIVLSGCGNAQFRPDTRWDLINSNIQQMNGVRPAYSAPPEDMSPIVGTPTIQGYTPPQKTCYMENYRLIGGGVQQRYVCK